MQTHVLTPPPPQYSGDHTTSNTTVHHPIRTREAYNLNRVKLNRRTRLTVHTNNACATNSGYYTCATRHKLRTLPSALPFTRSVLTVCNDADGTTTRAPLHCPALQRTALQSCRGPHYTRTEGYQAMLMCPEGQQNHPKTLIFNPIGI